MTQYDPSVQTSPAFRVSRRTFLSAAGVGAAVAAVPAAAAAVPYSPGGTVIMSAPAGTEANKELVRAYTQAVFNEHHTDRASEFLAPDVKWHGGTLGTVEGLDNVAALLRGIIDGLPDLTATEQDMVAEGDTVAVRYVVEGTHTGDLLGIPATDRRVRWDAVDVYRVSNGKLVEEWAADDMLAVLVGLGVYTPPWLAGR